MKDWNPSLPATAVRNMDRLLPAIDANAEQFRALQAPAEFEPMHAACQKSLDLNVQASHATRNAMANEDTQAATKALSAVTLNRDAANQAQLVCNDEIDKLKG